MSILDELNKRDERVIHRYDVPERVGQGEYKTLGMVELTGHDELQAAKRAHGDAIALAWELAKQSLREVNGERVSVADGSVEKAFNRMPPRVRSLVMAGYSDLHNVEEEDSKAFLKTRKASV